MTTMMTNVEKLEERYLEQMKQLEDPVVRFAGEASERLARFVPERPAFMADLPKMGEFVESQLKFQKKVVDEQLRFARKMLKAMDPLFVKVDAQPKRVTVAQSTPTTTTRRPARTRKAA